MYKRQSHTRAKCFIEEHDIFQPVNWGKPTLWWQRDCHILFGKWTVGENVSERRIWCQKDIIFLRWKRMYWNINCNSEENTVKINRMAVVQGLNLSLIHIWVKSARELKRERSIPPLTVYPERRKRFFGRIYVRSLTFWMFFSVHLFWWQDRLRIWLLCLRLLPIQSLVLFRS